MACLLCVVCGVSVCVMGELLVFGRLVFVVRHWSVGDVCRVWHLSLFVVGFGCLLFCYYCELCVVVCYVLFVVCRCLLLVVCFVLVVVCWVSLDVCCLFVFGCWLLVLVFGCRV